MAKIRKKCLLLSVLVFIFLLCIALATVNGEDTAISTFSKVHYPIKSVETEKANFTLTANITSDNKERDIKLLCDVCQGLGVSVCFFMPIDLVKSNSALTDYITKSGHHIGLYISEDLSNYRRSEIMRRIAAKNDVFFTSTGKYPKYVRLAESADSESAEILNAYGQYNIASSLVIQEATADLLNSGSIVELTTVDSNAPYLIAEFLANSYKRGLTAIPLKELLYDIESEVDANGQQIS